MNKLIPLTILIVLLGCNQKKQEDVTEPIHSIDSSKMRPDQTEEITKDVPSQMFFRFVNLMKKEGFQPDTNRIKKVPYYFKYAKRWEVETRHDIPFNPIPPDQTPLSIELNLGLKNHGNLDSIWAASFLSTNPFDSVGYVNGIFVTQPPTHSTMTTDLFMEEWIFSDSTQATIFRDKLLNDYLVYHVYFNSYVKLLPVDNRLYIFFSRATWADRLLTGMIEGLKNEIVRSKNSSVAAPSV